MDVRIAIFVPRAGRFCLWARQEDSGKSRARAGKSNLGRKSVSRRATSPDGSKVERRKANRFPVAVPIEASWAGPDGTAIKQDALAKQVNAHGGLLQMESYPEIGTRVTLTNFFSAETAEARVLATPYTREGVSEGIVVELVVPSESFWGVSLQVRKTANELQRLEKSLRSEGADRRLLKEFRDLVEHVRTAAAIVQQLRECQITGQEDGEAVAALLSARVRRATTLCLEVLTDLDAGKINDETEGLEEFQAAIEQAFDRVNQLVKHRRREPVLATRS
jgi:hypothetical protein